MRDDAVHLDDIVEAAEHISNFLASVAREQFVASELLRSAVAHKLTVIGEAASRLSKEFKDRHSEIPWAQIVGLRNVAVHYYFGIRWEDVWVAATIEAPTLGQQIAHIVADEFPECESEQ